MTALPHARPSQVAAYIQRMVAELSGMATASDLDFLAYLLDIAHAEAAARAVDDDESGGSVPIRRSAR